MADPVPDTISPPRPDAVLPRLVALALKAVAAQSDAFLARLAGVLAHTASAGKDADQARHAAHAGEVLGARGKLFQQRMLQALERGLASAMRAILDPGLSRLRRDALDLSASTFEAMQDKVLLENLADAIDKRHAASLDGLTLRLGQVLRTDELGSAQNPFRAAVFLEAVADAWTDVDPDPAGRRIMLRHLRPEVFLQLDPLLQALCQLMPLPLAPAQEESSPPARKAAEPPARRRGDSVIGKLQQWLSPRVPSHSRSSASTYHPALRAYLTDLQRRYVPAAMPDAEVLRRVLREAPAGLFSQQDHNAVELLAATFELIFREAPLPGDIKRELGRLQIPALKASLADKDFFFTPEHPARRFIEAVAQAGRACDPRQGREDPLFKKLQHAIDRLLRDFDDQLELFDRGVARLNAFYVHEEAESGGKVALAIEAALRQEQEAEALVHAEETVIARIETGDVANFIETFLQAQWIPVLAAATRAGRPAQALATMEALIDSVKPKSSPEERRQVLSGIPGLLAELNAALDALPWAGPERESFFAALAERHAAVVRTPLETMPRQQLEIALNLAQKASEHRLTRRSLEQEKSVDEFVHSVNALAPGSRVDFKRGNGSALRCRVAWISPGRTRFVFHARQLHQVFTLASDTMSQVLRNGQVALVSSDDIMARALAGALADMNEE
ncbi:DUF1631 family protein [Noviherbaspirillum galbum]|uniref:DUF1631 domain-containing protein n=1 Tax=Noviherbaspirillum galbum TaxID=2709383 RepID=A0A6B3STQ1_9BURK|nr:DUF1631 family protein [Noviherbaspirillum galbum]NEX64380.1 DUF1631 domain-containing protein [Noviherbaspirillum galbum]